MELSELRRVLTLEDEGARRDFCLLQEGGYFLTGLLDYVTSNRQPWLSMELHEEQPLPRRPQPKIPRDYVLIRGDRPLWDHQVSMTRKAIAQGRGIIEVATGGGKTGIAAALIKYYLYGGHLSKGGALFVVGGKHLLDQAWEEFRAVGLKSVGRLGDGRADWGQEIQVSTAASLWARWSRKDPMLLERLASTQLLIYDECHHSKSMTWYSIGCAIEAPYRFGLSATAYDDPRTFSPRDLLVTGLTGPTIAKVSAAYLRAKGLLAKAIVSLIGVQSPALSLNRWQDIYAQGIVQNDTLNESAARLAAWLQALGLQVLLLVQHKEQGDRIFQRLLDLGVKQTLFTTGQGWTTYLGRDGVLRERWSLKNIREWVAKWPGSVTIATPVFDEGVDIPEMNALIVAGGMKSYRRLVQRMGRVLRAKPGDNQAYIFDFIPSNHETLLDHAAERVEVYKMEEIPVYSGIETAERMLGARFQ